MALVFHIRDLDAGRVIDNPIPKTAQRGRWSLDADGKLICRWRREPVR